MGVKRGKEEMIFRCDNQDCTKTARRKIVVDRYNRQTGNTRRHYRRPKHPFSYWRKLLEPNFFLSGYGWPDGTMVLCKKCHAEKTQAQKATPHKPKPLSKQREREMRRYQEKRIDIF